MSSLSEIVISCQGCIEDQSELTTHMGIGGCLYIRRNTGEDDISIMYDEDQEHVDTIITISDIEDNVQQQEEIHVTGYQIYDVIHTLTRMYQNLKNSWTGMILPI